MHRESLAPHRREYEFRNFSFCFKEHLDLSECTADAILILLQTRL